MDFSDKYISTSMKKLDPESKKKVISDNSYATLDAIQDMFKDIIFRLTRLK